LKGYAFLFFWLMAYPALGSVYPFLPPLLGYAYIRWREALNRQSWFDLFIWFFYAMVVETVWSLPMFGSWIVMILLYWLTDAKLRVWFTNPMTVRLLGVLLFDGAYYGYLRVAGWAAGDTVIVNDPILLFDLMADLVWAVLF
jgi:hypothetical protein